MASSPRIQFDNTSCVSSASSAKDSPSTDGNGVLGCGGLLAAPSIVARRVQLLEVARQERDRRLRMHEFLSGRCRQFEDYFAQTDSDSSFASHSSCQPGLLGRQVEHVGWSQVDDDAQIEAISTIRMLKRMCQERTAAQPAELITVSGASDELHQQLAKERHLRMRLQEQVCCIESDLRSRESEIQGLQRALEQLKHNFRQALSELCGGRQEAYEVVDAPDRFELEASAAPGEGLRQLVAWQRSAAEPDLPYDYERIRAHRKQVLDLECELQTRNH